VVNGPEGSGKTELVKQYATKHREKYHHVWYVGDDWETDFKKLAKTWNLFPGLDVSKQPIEDIVQAVFSEFSQHHNKRSLIVFDVDKFYAIENFIDIGLLNQTDVLVVQRFGITKRHETVDLRSKEFAITEDEGLKLIQKFRKMGNTELEDAKKIITLFSIYPDYLIRVILFIPEIYPWEIF
jgi:Ni2+-binding GTPase involved in maturation of urease and hydrogenase